MQMAGKIMRKNHPRATSSKSSRGYRQALRPPRLHDAVFSA
jgi:hypothetical protein